MEDYVYHYKGQPAASQLDSSRDWLAQKIEGVSSSLDSFFIEKFFGDQILDDNIEGNRAVISLHTRRVMGGKVSYSLDGRVKLVLPNTDKRLKLLISSDDDSEYSVERDPLRNIENATYSTALRFMLLEGAKWKTDLDAGMRWNSIPDPFTRLRFRRRGELGNWHSQFTQSFYHYALDGAGEKTDLYTDYSLTEDKLLRLSTSADYKRKNGYFDIDYGVTLYHRLQNKAMFAYVLGASGDTEFGASFKNYFAGVRYRRLIYKDWIFAEISPQQEWNYDNNYRRQAVIMFKIEAVIE